MRVERSNDVRGLEFSYSHSKYDVVFKITNRLKFNNDNFKLNGDFKCHIIFEEDSKRILVLLISLLGLEDTTVMEETLNYIEPRSSRLWKISQLMSKFCPCKHLKQIHHNNCSFPLSIFQSDMLVCDAFVVSV